MYFYRKLNDNLLNTCAPRTGRFITDTYIVLHCTTSKHYIMTYKGGYSRHSNLSLKASKVSHKFHQFFVQLLCYVFGLTLHDKLGPDLKE